VEAEAVVPLVASGKTTIGTLMASSGTKLWLGNQEALTGDYHILQPIAFGAQNSANQGDSVSTEITPTLDKSKTPAVMNDLQVRRLTPTECERLQGFPDNYTQIEWRNKAAEECPDGPRYKAMGNSMAVPVMRWIGERIQMVENLDG
jgi:DNA (cytosine-5)-methyltransferase 1